MNRSTRILVTGGTGMVGSYLLRYLLDQGYQEVVALRRPQSNMDLLGPAADRIEWREGDLLDLPALELAMDGAEQVYHCAALISFDPADFDRMKRVNVEGTANVVNLALAQGVRKLVHVSSTAAVGRTVAGETLRESNVWQRGRFNTSYAISKFLAEQEVWRGQVEGLTAAIVNPAVVLGSGRWQDGPLRIFSLVWKRFPFYTLGLNGFVDVRDVARFMIRLMESPISGQRYILSAENMGFRELMQGIARQLDRPPPQLPMLPWIGEASWRLSWPLRQLGLANTITKESVRIASRRFPMDNSKSLQAFPDFTYTPIQQTLAETSRQFREAAQDGLAPRRLPLLGY